MTIFLRFSEIYRHNINDGRSAQKHWTFCVKTCFSFWSHLERNLLGTYCKNNCRKRNEHKFHCQQGCSASLTFKLSASRDTHDASQGAGFNYRAAQLMRRQLWSSLYSLFEEFSIPFTFFKNFLWRNKLQNFNPGFLYRTGHLILVRNVKQEAVKLIAHILVKSCSQYLKSNCKNAAIF